MKQTHDIKTWMPFFQDIIDGKKPFEFRLNDRNYQIGDEIHHIEWDEKEQKETGRQCWAKITYLLKGGTLGIPSDCCIFVQHTNLQQDFIRDFSNFNKAITDYESKMTSRYGGNLTERLYYVLEHFNSAATDSIWKGKNFLGDVKTQFKALELTLEGVTSEAYNHGQKRVIANHVINMLRGMVDRIDRVQWDFSSGMYDNYNYFRSETPEGDLMKRYRSLKEENERLKGNFKALNEKLPDELKDDLPF